MKINELRKLLRDKRVIEEIYKHLWIENQKVGYNIGIGAGDRRMVATACL